MKRKRQPGSDQETRTQGHSMQWVAHLPKEKHQEFLEQLARDIKAPTLRRLTTIIDQQLTKLERSNDFDKASWAYHEAYKNGQRHSLLTLKDLISE